MTEFFEDFIRHPRALVKTVIAIVAILGLVFKVIVPKVRERIARVKEVKSTHSGEEYLKKGMELYNQNNFDDGIALLIKGLELGNFDLHSANASCKMLIDYYYNRNEEHNSLRWARFALDNNCCDNQILSYMIDVYNRMDETSKAEELKELLKNS